MAKSFQVTGNCISSKHYMVDVSEKINRIVTEYIQPGYYFTMNRARQYGKTTTLYLLEENLKKDYIVISLSFESADEYFKSTINLVEGLIMDISDSLIMQNVSSEIIEEWNSPISEHFPMRSLGVKITNLCRKAPKEVILMIDEVDKSTDNQIFVSLLALFREKYQKQLMGKDSTFKSVILAGVYDIKNLKLKLHPDEETKNNSPWNIAADFLVDMSFSASDIQSMLKEYEKDYHTDMEIEQMSKFIYDYTSGYPYLVSKICQFIDERVAGDIYLDRKNAWTREGFLEAIRLILKESNTLFDDMIKHLYEYPKLRQMIKNILFQGMRYTFEADSQVIRMGIMFGFLKEYNGVVAISNRIFETKLYNFLLSEEENDGIFRETLDVVKNQFVTQGMLQMDLVMKKFYEYFQSIYQDTTSKFIEEEGRRIFLMYLRPIINGTGNYYIEAQTRDKTRTDVIVDYRGQQFVIELKLWKGESYHHSGQVQLAEYLELYNLDRGYLLTFNFNKHKKIGISESVCNGKKILEVIV
jgi:hypothetical protein